MQLPLLALKAGDPSEKEPPAAETGVKALQLGRPGPNLTPATTPWECTHNCIFHSNTALTESVVQAEPAAMNDWVTRVLNPIDQAFNAIDPSRSFKIGFVTTATFGNARKTPEDRRGMIGAMVAGCDTLRRMFSLTGRAVEVYPIHLYSSEAFEPPAAQLVAEYEAMVMRMTRNLGYPNSQEDTLNIVQGPQSQTKQILANMFSKVEMMHIEGGQTHWLLNRMAGAGYDNAIAGFRGIVSGSSAGTNVHGMHTMLQAWKCQWAGCDDDSEAGLATAPITNTPSVCGPAETGSCYMNGMEVTNRAHYCHYVPGDAEWLKRFYLATDEAISPYQTSLPQVMADGECIIGGPMFMPSGGAQRLPSDSSVASVRDQRVAFMIPNIVHCRAEFGRFT